MKFGSLSYRLARSASGHVVLFAEAVDDCGMGDWSDARVLAANLPLLVAARKARDLIRYQRTLDVSSRKSGELDHVVGQLSWSDLEAYR